MRSDAEPDRGARHVGTWPDGWGRRDQGGRGAGMAEEDQRTRPASETRRRRKIEKLKVKEEMERLRAQTE